MVTFISFFQENLINVIGHLKFFIGYRNFNTKDNSYNNFTTSVNTLTLNNQQVNSTSTELNKTIVTPGTASSNKVLVVNSNKNISNINSLSCQDIIINGTSLNSITAIGTAVVDLTGQSLTASLNSVTVIGSATVSVTGNTLTIALNSVNPQVWTIIDTGTTVSYTNRSTGTTATWTDVDTAA